MDTIGKQYNVTAEEEGLTPIPNFTYPYVNLTVTIQHITASDYGKVGKHSAGITTFLELEDIFKTV
jgi:hypothetical protein